jgi:hypothetical protein
MCVRLDSVYLRVVSPRAAAVVSLLRLSLCSAALGERCDRLDALAQHALSLLGTAHTATAPRPRAAQALHTPAPVAFSQADPPATAASPRRLLLRYAAACAALEGHRLRPALGEVGEAAGAPRGGDGTTGPGLQAAVSASALGLGPVQLHLALLGGQASGWAVREGGLRGRAVYGTACPPPFAWCRTASSGA